MFIDLVGGMVRWHGYLHQPRSQTALWAITDIPAINKLSDFGLREYLVDMRNMIALNPTYNFCLRG